MKALVGAFNQEKALVGAFSVIVKTGCGTDGTLNSTSDNNDMAELTYLVIFFAINVNGCYFQFTEPGLCPSEVMVIWQYLNTVHS